MNAAPAAEDGFALQVFVADRSGSAAPLSASGGAPFLAAEAVRLVRQLPSVAMSTPTAAQTEPTEAEVSEQPTPTSTTASSGALTPSLPPLRSEMWIDLVAGPSERVPSADYWLSPEVGFNLRANDLWMVDFAFGAALGDGSKGQNLGNPFVGLTRTLALGQGRLGVGGLLSLPLTSALDSSQRLFGADAMRGWWDGWRWTSDALALIGRVHYLWQAGQFELRGAFAMGFLIPTGNDLNDVHFTAQFGAMPFLRVSGRGGLGLDLRGVWRPAFDGAFQISVVPRVRFALGSSDLDLWLNLNLNEPLGWSLDKYGAIGFGMTLRVPL